MHIRTNTETYAYIKQQTNIPFLR